MVLVISKCGFDIEKKTPGVGQNQPPPPGGVQTHPIFVAAGDGGLLMVSTDKLNWTQAPVGTGTTGDNNFQFRGACVGDSTVIAVGGGTPTPGSKWSRIAATEDGTTWTETYGNYNWLGGCAFGDGVFLAGGGQGGLLRSEDRGQTWTALPSVADAHGTFFTFRHLMYLGETFYGTGEQGIAFSSDQGETWTIDNSQTTVTDIAYGGG